MKNAIKKCIFVCSVLCSAVFWSSCQDNLEYYDTPDNLKGSIYETLEDRGNYSIFLKGVDLGGYAPILKGKGVWTVMAPNDEAFASYLKSEYGVNSIEELSVDEIKKLIGFHIMYYSFDKNKLINFRPDEGDGATDEELMVNAGLYYKFRTKSQDALTLEVVNDTTGNLSMPSIITSIFTPPRSGRGLRASTYRMLRSTSTLLLHRRDTSIS